MRNVFVENFSEKQSYTKCGGKTSPRLFTKKSSISWDQRSIVLHSLFLLYAQVEGYRIILKLSCRALGFFKRFF